MLAEEYSQLKLKSESSGDSDESSPEKDAKADPLKPGAEPLYVKLTVNSYDCLRRGIDAFTAVKDNVNLAFLYCNMGRFMRLRAHLTMPNERWVE